jgi:hypothetical protein
MEDPFEKLIELTLSRNSPSFKESEGSLSCRQETATVPNFEPHKFSFHFRLNILKLNRFYTYFRTSLIQ